VGFPTYSSVAGEESVLSCSPKERFRADGRGGGRTDTPCSSMFDKSRRGEAMRGTEGKNE